ncbi:hypothetical protein ABK905_18905 [Acerihabitans sp. KWT182]|uniref:Major facilitator superfamily (MFS) profile domain-containing protein n=1 Tax=Acerihabitans sp. KWT182 TaxID=3157919 RepID=A0AAU7Q6H7_9GAMM
MYSLFASIVGYYYGEVASGSNYGMLYATAKGLGGIYGGVLASFLITTYGHPFTIIVSSVMALLSGFILLPLWKHPPHLERGEPSHGNNPLKTLIHINT